MFYCLNKNWPLGERKCSRQNLKTAIAMHNEQGVKYQNTVTAAQPDTTVQHVYVHLCPCACECLLRLCFRGAGLEQAWRRVGPHSPSSRCAESLSESQLHNGGDGGQEEGRK